MEVHDHDLTKAIHGLTHALTELLKSETTTILKRIEKNTETIMEAIVQFSNRVNTAFDAIGTSVDEIVASQSGITQDIASLKDIIVKLQNTPGTLTPEDQALLDSSEAKVNALVSKTAAVSAALKALDEATESAPVPTP